MTSLALFADSLDAPIIVRREGVVCAGEFVGATQALLQLLPTARHVVNLCERRYFFLLALVAAGLRKQVTLLPPDQSKGALRQLQMHYPDCVVVDDACIAELLRTVRIEKAVSPPNWQLDGDGVAAYTFTSGSTGAPQAHEKTWRTLSENATLAATEILSDQILSNRGMQLVATVPAQHVYGLETTAMTALVAGCAVFDGKPFFPRDVCAALALLDSPRILVTTPTHLKNLFESHVELPALRGVVSATAPLSIELAERIEAAWRTEVFEIYGCTEAGVMAKRRTVDGPLWRTFTGGRMTMDDGDVAYYSAPQLPARVRLQDVLELRSPTEFSLLGRSADMIKVAGKRTSLQTLTQHLLGIDGVQDAAVFLPTPDARPAALAVAPQLTPREILGALSERIDAVFLPRPLILLERLPRNSLGKLTRDELLQALREHNRPHR